MSYTDREILKQEQSGALATSGATDPIGTVGAAHSITRSILVTDASNAATNVSETAGFVVNRKSLVKSIKLNMQANVANDTTDYDVITFFARSGTNAVTQATIGSWNTHTSAQGALVKFTPASCSLATNSNVVVAAGSVITYQVLKFGSGKAVTALWTADVDLEHV